MYTKEEVVILQYPTKDHISKSGGLLIAGTTDTGGPGTVIGELSSMAVLLLPITGGAVSSSKETDNRDPPDNANPSELPEPPPLGCGDEPADSSDSPNTSTTSAREPTESKLAPGAFANPSLGKLSDSKPSFPEKLGKPPNPKEPKEPYEDCIIPPLGLGVCLGGSLISSITVGGGITGWYGGMAANHRLARICAGSQRWDGCG